MRQSRQSTIIHQKYIPFNAMRKTWQYQVLTQFKAALPKNRLLSVLIDQLFKKYRNGFYVHLPKEFRITNNRRIARYIARYIRHPAVANTRLHRYDGKSVPFYLYSGEIPRVETFCLNNRERHIFPGFSGGFGFLPKRITL
jgi:hypothetical protein